LAVIQVVWVPALAVAGVKPDLPLALAVLIGLWSGPVAGVGWGIGLGACLDLFSLAPFGIHLVLTGLSGAAAGWVRTQMNQQYFLAPALIFAGISVLHMAAFWLIHAITYPGYALHVAMVEQGFKGTLYGAVLAPLGWRVWAWWDGRRKGARLRYRTWNV